MVGELRGGGLLTWRLLAAAALCLLSILPAQIQTEGTQAASHVATAAVPPAARLLAHRLGIRGAAFVGDDVGGVGRPWTVWFPRSIDPRAVGAGKIPRRRLNARGAALFT